MKNNTLRYWLLAGVISTGYVWTSQAQPGNETLAQRIEAAHARHLEQIERLTVVAEMEGGMVPDMQTTSRYVKVEEDGRAVLRAVEQDDRDAMNLAGIHDGTLPEMVRHAKSIRADRLDGRAVFVVEIDDAEFLESLDDLHIEDDLDEDELLPKHATIWLDTSDYTPHQLAFVQRNPQGDELTFEIKLSDYQVHRGLPIAHRMEIAIQGLDQMITPDELAQARQQMAQMEEQLAMLPAEQRAMIQQQLAPQLEQLEQMMTSGGATMHVRVVDVQVE